MKKQLYAWEVQEVPMADEMEKCHLCNASFEEGESLSLAFVKGEVNHLICELCASFLTE